MKVNSEKYAGKTILAPMVKIGTLPTRILALRYGADLVYSEEIIDHKFLQATRVVNEATGTIDYLDVEGSVFFQTCEEEKSKVILQIGTCDPDRALQVAKLTENDIAGIDINMGCPKGFSLKGGMGAALLRQPEKIKSILETLVANVNIPVTCKIRVLPTLEETLELCKLIEATGVSAIGIHGRTKEERQQHKNRNHFLKAIAAELKIPVIANGGSKEIKVFSDIQRFRDEAGCSSVMLARAAEWNLSIFADKEKEGIHTVIRNFLKLAVDFNLSFHNAKYTVQCILRDEQDSPFGRKFLGTQIMAELCELWQLTDYYQQKQKEQSTVNRKRNSTSTCESDSESKKIKIVSNPDNDGTVIVVPSCVYIRGHYANVNILPKSILLKWSKKNAFSRLPDYKTEGQDKKFRSTVSIGGQTFRTDVWEKNKKCAEQGAALACIKYLGIVGS